MSEHLFDLFRLELLADLAPEYLAESENIREPILDFTPRFGEINPDMLYLCRRGLPGPERAVFASFPSVRREAMKKIVKSSIFCEKTSKFLSSLPFKVQTI